MYGCLSESVIILAILLLLHKACHFGKERIMSQNDLQIPFQNKHIEAVLDHPHTKTSWSKFGVILTHGAGGDMYSKQLEALTNQLIDIGILVVRFNCKPPNFEYRVKVYTAVLEYVKDSLGISSCIIGGRSMGGRVAAELVTRLPNCDRFLLGVCCFSYPLHRPKQYNNLRVSHISNVSVPMFIINGTEDTMCRKDLMNDCLSQLSSNISMNWVNKADHSLNIGGKFSDNCMKKVSDLFIEWCKSVLTIETL